MIGHRRVRFFRWTRIACVLAAALTASAQNPFGRMTGRVVDATNAVVPAAKVQAVNVETGVVSSTVSNADGNFELLNLIPGRYRLTVEAAGFKRYERGPLEVRLGDVLNLAASLEVGAQAESVTVTAEAPLLQSATASLGQVVDRRNLLDLPSPGNFIYLMTTLPGVTAIRPAAVNYGPENRPAANNFSVAGTPGASSGLYLDGIPNSKVQESNAPSFIPPAVAVQEMRVETTTFDASVGKFTGAYVNMVMKSGTNDFHGIADYSFYGTPTMTKPFFVNKSFYDLGTGAPTREKERRLWPYTKQNVYRGTAGGPVYIPRLYNGRNRTFWQFTLEVTDRTWPYTGFQTVPSPSQRQGDFSELLRVGAQYQVYDPATIAAAPNGRFSRQPFPGNVIPVNRLNPMSLRMLQFYALPNTGGTADGRQNWTGSSMNSMLHNQQIVRVDQVVADNHRIFVTLTRNNQDQQDSDYFGNQSAGNHYYPWAHKGLALDDTITLRADLVLNLRYGLSRFKQRTTPPSLGLVDMTELGLAPELVRQLDKDLAALPLTEIAEYYRVGGPNNYRTGELSHLFLANATHIRGVHSLRFGGELRLLQDNWNNFNASYAPRYTFATNWTRGPLDTSAASPIGQGLASFLLGLPTAGFFEQAAARSARQKFFALFLQDDWKVTRKLTMNLGLRYEYETPVFEVYDRANRGVDLATPNPISAAAKANYALSPIPEVDPAAFRTLGGLQFAGVKGAPRGMWDSNRLNFAPRVGLAYQLRPSTVVRAGYAIYYKTLGLGDETSVNQQGFSQRTNLVPTLDNGLTFIANIQNPFPDGLLKPQGAEGELRTFLGNSLGYFNPGRRNPYMQRWSFTIQHQLPGQIILEAGYTGNRGTALPVATDYNAIPAQYYSTSPVRDQARIDYLAAPVSNPFFGIPEFQGTGMAGRTVARSALLRPYPHFTGLNTSDDSGFSWYHGGHVRFEKRFSRGATLQANYTWSKTMEATQRLNPSDPDTEHVISSLDRPHHFSLTGIYEFPFGRGKTLLAGAPRWMDHVVGGWSVQGVYTALSGTPVEWGNIAFYGDVHDIVLPRGERTVERWFNTAAGFERNTQRQLGSNIRTFPSRLTGVRTPGANLADMSLFKNFRLLEGIALQLRAEGQNAFNHPQFAAPNASPINSLFGQITNSYSLQRVIRVGARLTW